MKTLSEEFYSIMSDAMKEILKRTEDHKSARDSLVDSVCLSCILALTNSKYKKDEKIDSFKRQVERCVSDIDKTIEDFSHCTCTIE